MALDVRAAAGSILGEVLKGHSLNQALPPYLDKVSERDRGLLQQLCYGTLRESPRLQGLLEQLLDKPLRDKDSDVHGLLLCGLYQLDSMRIPDHAAVAATVGATRTLKKHWAKGMANAVLRRYLRERGTLSKNLTPAATASHPAWLYNAIREQWTGSASAIVDSNNQQPPMTLRVNRQRSNRDKYLEMLAGEGINASAGDISPQAIMLSQPRDVLDIPGFSDGCSSVQDEAAQVAALVLGAAPGERILDACAAPGGKACHILELQPQLGELVVMDIDDQRLQRVTENLDRLGLSASLLAGDAAQPPARLAARSFDRILVDAPCSASGVIRRHPDVKLLRRNSDIDRFAKQQLAILEGLWPLLKAGGTLLYATCSILQEENNQVITRFLDKQSDAAADSSDIPFGQTAGHGRQLLPTPLGPDGLFYARLLKAS